jgi:hypothetical protein
VIRLIAKKRRLSGFWLIPMQREYLMARTLSAGRPGDHLGVSRRDFLRVGVLGVGGLSLADVLRLRAQAPFATARAVITINLNGGPPHIDMYDLKPDAPAEYRGEFQPIRTNVPGFDICELMVEQAKIADKLAVVRNLQMSTNAHNEGREVFSGFLYEDPGARGKLPGAKGDPRPSYGCVINKFGAARNGMPPHVSLRGLQSYPDLPWYLGKGYEPFSPPLSPAGLPLVDKMSLTLDKGLTMARLEERTALLQSFDRLRRDIDHTGAMTGMDRFTAQALDMITSPRVRDAFDFAREPKQLQERYSNDRDGVNRALGMKFLIARRLVEAGVAAVSLDAFSWDTHSDNFPICRRQLPLLDRMLAALVSDLAERGLDKEVLVVMWGEFGRSPKIYFEPGKKTAGRDHHGPANFVLFAGGGLKMGQVVGATDARAERPVGVPYRPQNVVATIYRALGIDPETTVPDHSGRPMYLLDERDPIRELV